MSGLQWYPRFPGDYGRDTSHLSMLEHGAYTLLMDHYYSHAKPLPAHADAHAPSLALTSNDRLHRICRATTQAERDAVDFVINEFFELVDGEYHQTRIDEEIEKRLSISESRKKANETMRENKRKKRGKRKTSAKANAPTSADTHEDVLHSTTTTTTTNKKYIKKDFERFFEVYPKQIEPHEAEQAFMEAVESGDDPNQIIEAARQYGSEQADNEKKFIKSPITFIDKKVYLSPEYNKKPSKPVDLSKYEDWQQKLAKEIGTGAMNSWFGKAVIDGTRMIVETRFIQDWVKNNYLKEINALGVQEVIVKNV